MQEISLCDLPIGSEARVLSVEGCGEIKRRFMDLGLIKGAIVKCVGSSPLGNPKAYEIMGAVIAIRKSDCERVMVLQKEGYRDAL